MNIESSLFYTFAALTLLFALMVVANPFSRNLVTGAMFLVLTIVSMAGLFVLLQGFFLAAVQILVYAGAVMVLFLFVIMLLNPGEEERRVATRWGAGLATLVAAVVVSALLIGIERGGIRTAPKPHIEGDTLGLGRLLFSDYLLPFEVVSVLLLAAMIGVVVLSKKNLKS